MAVYVEDLGFVPSGQQPLLLAIWPDGTAVWSTNRLEGGAPYRTGKVEPKRVTEFLKRVETDGLFADKKTRRSQFGPDSRFTTVFIKSGKNAITMQSWHELGEAGGGWAGKDGGLTLLEGKRRLDVIRESSADYLYFRLVWAETRSRLNDLLPTESKPISGRTVMKAGEFSWEEEPVKEGADKKPADHVEIIVKLFANPPMEIGPKSRVDVGGITDSSVKKLEFPSNVEVVSLDRAAKTATLRLEKKDEAMMNRAVKFGLLYLTPHRERKDGKP
jgi:hypothetical protein